MMMMMMLTVMVVVMTVMTMMVTMMMMIMMMMMVMVIQRLQHHLNQGIYLKSYYGQLRTNYNRRRVFLKSDKGLWSVADDGTGGGSGEDLPFLELFQPAVRQARQGPL